MSERGAWIWIAVLATGGVVIGVLFYLDAPPLDPIPTLKPPAMVQSNTPERPDGERASEIFVATSRTASGPIVSPRLSDGEPEGAKESSLVDTSLVEEEDAAMEQERVYAIDALPQARSGLYWVRDSEGQVAVLAVDRPGGDEPMGDGGDAESVE